MKIKNKSENISKSRKNLKFLNKINSSNFALKKMIFFKKTVPKKKKVKMKKGKKKNKYLETSTSKYNNKKLFNFRYQKNGLFPYITKPKKMKYCVYSYK